MASVKYAHKQAVTLVCTLPQTQSERGSGRESARTNGLNLLFSHVWNVWLREHILKSHGNDENLEEGEWAFKDLSTFSNTHSVFDIVCTVHYFFAKILQSSTVMQLPGAALCSCHPHNPKHHSKYSQAAMANWVALHFPKFKECHFPPSFIQQLTRCRLTCFCPL